MYKPNLLSLFIFLTFFLFIGCEQVPIETKNADTIEQEDSNQSIKSNETTDSETKKNDQDNLRSDSTVENQIIEGSNHLPELKVHYIDVGQGDSTLLQYSQDGEDFTILIDAGNWNSNNVVNYLNSQNVTQIDIAIGTHPDADHIGQLDKVLNTFEVGEVWLPGNTSTSQTFQRLLGAIDSSGVDYYEPRMGDEFEIGLLGIDVLYPKTISEQDNEESISLKITYGEVRFIFTGDASKSDELNMLQSGFNLQADILHLGHHGSSTSTHPSFLSEVKPSIAIYSAGLNNSYGHPHEEVVDLVQSSGVNLYGTDVHGTVIVTTDGKDYKVFTKMNGTISPASNSQSNHEKDSEREPAPSTNSCIDVNSATPEQLQEIIHIGPARATDLIDLRPFDSVDDLTIISGLGASRIQDIKSQGLACIGG
ncbi:MBL fold metallo-hydrolase [Bacillus sp. DJP31]|uniref:MBL fold metallo-hydrolase n=1 Tax=Bacillus sp. DJP31 TaxID=3409789 RepID=UPI003BB5A4D6